MKNRIIIAPIIIIILLFLAMLSSYAANSKSDKEAFHEKTLVGLFSDSTYLASEMTKVVGFSISPLLAMSSYGAYNWWNSDEESRATLQWHNKPVFWLPLLILLLIIILKDSISALLPFLAPLKKPFDALELIENKLSGLIAIPIVLSSFTNPSVKSDSFGINFESISNFITTSAYASETINQIPSIDLFFTFKIIAFVTLGVLVYLLVWLVSHSISVLILISPFSILDATLKGFKVFTIGILLGASLVHPFLGLAVAIIVTIACYFMANWSLRLLVFGSILSWDILSQAAKKETMADQSVNGFACKGFGKTPFLSYGNVSINENEKLEFTYRPWMIFPTRTIVSKNPAASYEIGLNLIGPKLIIQEDGQDRDITVLWFPPKYKTKEVLLHQRLGTKGIKDVSFHNNFKSGINWIQSLYSEIIK